MFKALVIAAFIAICVADDAPYNAPGYKPSTYKTPSYEDVPAKYNFDWSVKDDPSYNNFGQTENRDASNTDGSYFVLLPDGRTQYVKYYVNGDSGYVAEVTYSGEAKYEASYKKPAYAPAPASYKSEEYKPAPATYKTEQYKPAPASYKTEQYKPTTAAYKAEEYNPTSTPAYEQEYKAAPSYQAPAYKPAPYKAPASYKPAAAAYKAPTYPAPASYKA